MAEAQSDGGERVYDLREVQARLRLGESTIYALLRTGELASCKIGRRRVVSASQLAAFIAKLEAQNAQSAPER